MREAVDRSELKGVFLGGPPEIRGGMVDLLLEAEARDPDRVQLRWPQGGAMTVGELAQCARRWASLLQRHGIVAGDRVAIVCGNSAEVIALQFGVYMCGAVEVPINSELRGAMMSSVLLDADPALIVVEADLAETVVGKVPEGAAVLTLDEGLQAEIDAIEPIAEPARPGASELALILYTSGTTGASKGVMLPHGYLQHCAAIWAGAVEVTADDTFFVPMPFFHIDAHVINALGLVTGSTLAFNRRFSVSRFWDEAKEMGANLFLLVGSMASALVARRPATPPEHGFRAGLLAPIADEVFAYFEDELGLPLIQLYGQTEAEAVVFNTLDRRSRGGTGWACCGFDIRVVDEHDMLVPVGASGRILYRPLEPNMLTCGYWRRPEATAAASRNLWWHTGDIGHIDEDGFLWFDGRASDSLRRRGENISAWELESAVAAAPGVRAAAAVAVPDEIGGEDEIKVFISIEDGAEWDPRTFFEYCSENLPRFAQPRFVVVIDDEAFVRGPGTGAIQKRYLSPDLEGIEEDRTLYIK